jgi:hypothetical protein
MEEDVRGNGRNSVLGYDPIKKQETGREGRCLVLPSAAQKNGNPSKKSVSSWTAVRLFLGVYKSRRSDAAFSCGFAIFLLPWQRVMSQFPLQAIR